MKRISSKHAISIVAAGAIAFASMVALPVGASAATVSAPSNLMRGYDPTATNPPAHNGLELGTRVTTSTDGYIVSVKYFRVLGDTSNHIAHVWDAAGTLLATKTFTNETASGWQTAYLSSPIAVAAGNSFTVSTYSSDYWYIPGDNFPVASSGSLTENGGSYLYSPGGLYPSNSVGGNYSVDLDFYTSIASQEDCSSVHGTIVDDMCTVTFDGQEHAGNTIVPQTQGDGAYYEVTVPTGVSNIRLTLQGGSGTGDGTAIGGLGAEYVSDYPVSPGDMIHLGLIYGAAGAICQDGTQLYGGDLALVEYPTNPDWQTAGGGGSAGCTYSTGLNTYPGGDGGDAGPGVWQNGHAGQGTANADSSFTAGGGAGSATNFSRVAGGAGIYAGFGSNERVGGLGGGDVIGAVPGGPGASGIFGAGGGAGGIQDQMGGAGGGGGNSISYFHRDSLVTYRLLATGRHRGYARLQFPVNGTLDTSVTISAPVAGVVTAGAIVTPAAAVNPNTCSTVGAAAVTWSLDKNPTSGVAGSFQLGGATWNTSSWQSGTYTVTATYPGAGNCNGSSTTVAVSVINAPTTTTITSPTAGLYQSGATLVGSASINPSWSTGATTWSLDKNPLTGQPGTYNLFGAVWATSKWQPGVYTLTASYLGSANTDASFDQVAVTIAANQSVGSAVGGGWINYSGANATSGGRANFGVEVHKVAATATTPAYFKGQLVFIQKNKWRVKTSLSNYSKSGTSPVTGTVSGVGALWRWDSSLNGGLGDWFLVSSQLAVEVKLQASVAGTKQKSAVPGSFGITLGGFKLPDGSVLPSTALQALQGGIISLY